MKLGAACYALIAVGWLVSGVLTLRGFGPYAGAERWFQVATAAVVGLTGVLFGVGAATRRGLIADRGPWICRRGWIVVIGLVATAFVLSLLTDQDGVPPFPNLLAAFIPPWVRRLQGKYYEGVQEAERELSPGEPGGVTRPVG
ncbi:hypothetical protein OHA18_21520 [Kribbella sp. NBC_00709]|uniref:hypothetical protein n=1 Tax=Kribbella sp. NBC_00709 TaxID=2975972 RepID=UPI002E282E16|nr:hypothetical protein [Kribbella sp. NBC_00709]